MRGPGGAGEPRRFYFRSGAQRRVWGGRGEGRSCRPTAAFPRAGTPVMPPHPTLPTAPGVNSRLFSRKTRKKTPFPSLSAAWTEVFPAAQPPAPLGMLFLVGNSSISPLQTPHIPFIQPENPEARSILHLRHRGERALSFPSGARGRPDGHTRSLGKTNPATVWRSLIPSFIPPAPSCVGIKEEKKKK